MRGEEERVRGGREIRKMRGNERRGNERRRDESETFDSKLRCM